jgi:PIN domain nuclease of toxin-antitoxin system
MNLLLDAHCLVWFRTGDERLSPRIREAIESEASRLVVSVASFWELSLKESLGRFRIEGGVGALYGEWIENGFADLLPIEWGHLSLLGTLPWLHRDPFDRLLIAQAMGEDLTLATADAEIRGYPGVRVLW